MVRLLVQLADHNIDELRQFGDVRWVSRRGAPVVAIAVQPQDVDRVSHLANVVRVQEDRVGAYMR